MALDIAIPKPHFDTRLASQGTIIDWCCNNRVEATFTPEQITADLFDDPVKQTNFNTCLSLLGSLTDREGKQPELIVGGRKIRELVGFKTIDMAGYVSRDSIFRTEHDLIRLSFLRKLLDKYPDSRMAKPDLDFFYEGLEAHDIAATFSSYGIQVIVNTSSTGGTTVVDVVGEKGNATFIRLSDSWQTGDCWPICAVKAKYNNESGNFSLGFNPIRAYFDPLQIPDLQSRSADDPQRVAAVSRALLWSCSCLDPQGNYLRTPNEQIDLFANTVAQIKSIYQKIQINPNQEILYRSALRDISLALRVILLSDWDSLANRSPLDEERAYFFGRIANAWYTSQNHEIYL